MTKKLFSCLLVLAFAAAMLFATPQAEALYGLKKWYLGVYDESQFLVTDATATVNVYVADSTTNATIYSDDKGTAKSNPWNVTDGEIEFYSSASSLDIVVNVGARAAKIDGITAVSTHRITVPTWTLTLQKSIPLTVQMFTDVTTGETIDAGEAPSLSVDNSIMDFDWADGETDKASVSFRVPYDYESGGYFRVWADEDAGGAVSALDFEVYVNQDETAFDAAATNQTPVALSGDPGSPEELTLTVTTDFASLTAGDLVTLNIWRDDTTYTGTAALEVYYAEFVYTAQQ